MDRYCHAWECSIVNLMAPRRRMGMHAASFSVLSISEVIYHDALCRWL